MKKIVLFALFVATQANATNLFTSDNQIGGKIVLTSTQTGCPSDAYQFFATQKGGHVAMAGCWKYVEPFIEAQDVNGNVYEWEPAGFTATEALKKQSKAKNERSM